MTGFHAFQPVDPWADFAAIPGLGPKLTDRVIRQLGIETLEQLELAAHTGRLQTVPGIGPRKACAIGRAAAEVLTERRRLRASNDTDLETPTSKRAKSLPPNSSPPEPSADGDAMPTVAQILIIDREYRHRARARTLPLVTPRRFNPDGAATLPVYRVQHGNTRYTAFYSNSPMAHALGKTLEWVIVLAQRGSHTFQYTVVTETRGSWCGQRVVRGREAECRALYGLDAA